MPDGFVVDVLGPFEATVNDAQILSNLLEQNEDLKSLLQPNDVFVLDRGFRDVQETLAEAGYKVLMPSLKGKKPQLSTEESNYSRFVTKIRWPVEAVHGVVGQKYRLIHNTLKNRLLPNAATYCKVACWLNNTFGKRLSSDEQLTDEIISHMKTRPQENTLAKEVAEDRWARRKTMFTVFDSCNDLEDFPNLTIKELKILFTGTYQLKLCVSYLAEMIEKDGSVKFSWLKADAEIIKVNVQSRHKNSKAYNCYINYKAHTDGCAGIRRYCCECANGNRTVGCCAHVACVIYYLSHGRFLQREFNPAGVLTDLFSIDNSIPVIADDSDDDE